MHLASRRVAGGVPHADAVPLSAAWLRAAAALLAPCCAVQRTLVHFATEISQSQSLAAEAAVDVQFNTISP